MRESGPRLGFAIKTPALESFQRHTKQYDTWNRDGKHRAARIHLRRRVRSLCQGIAAACPCASYELGSAEHVTACGTP